MSNFDNFAGQEITSGIRPNEPLMAFEEEATATKLANIQAVQGLLPKISKILVHETRIKDGALDAYFKKSSLPFGAGLEEIGFMDGAANAKNSGRCVPFGNATAGGQLDVINLAWSLNISVWDREINQNVLSAEELGAYVAQKLRTPYKTLAALKRNAEIQLVSDVIDGTRSVSSTDSSDGTGNSVTYSPNIKGYCGQIVDAGFVLPELVQGTVPSFAQSADALGLVKQMQDAAAEMMEEGTAYNVMGRNTFCLERPLCVMETRTLNAMDNAWALDGSDKKIPTRTAREYIRTFADIVEIPKFAELPTNASYTNKRPAAVLVDRDSLGEHIAWSNMESQRCVEQRMTGYNLGGASALHIFRGNPACAFITNTQ